MRDIYKLAGMRIRKLREKHGLTREYVAMKSGISPKFLYELETGCKGFSADTLHRLAQVLEVSSEYILSGKSAEIENREIEEVLNLFSEREIKELLTILRQLHNLMHTDSDI